MPDDQDLNPFRAPGAAHLEPTPEFPAGGLRPVPWEDEASYPGFWQRIGAMFSLLFSNPLELADRIPASEGLAPAWRFNLLMAAPYLAFTGVIFAFMGSMFAFLPKDPNMPKGVMAGLFAGELLFFLAIFLVGIFVYGAIFHCALWMWGGTREGVGLGQTIRTCGYVWGFANLGMLIPCLNIFVMLGGIVYLGMALARVHRTDTWRGICAMFTPVFVCCLGYAGLLIIGFTAGALSH